MHRKPAAKLLALAAGACLVVIGASGAASIATSPVPVKASTRDEVTPAAGGGYFTWAKSRRGHPNIHDVWAQQEGQAPFKVNPSGTSAFGGGVDGATLAYQQVRKYNSDIRLFDLVTRQRTSVPPGINTQRWEWGPTISGEWLEFVRGGYGGAQQLILRNLVTGEQRVLDAVGKRGSLASGQLNGNYAVWSRCRGNACDVFRYEIASGTRTAMPRNGQFLYAPSVVPAGTIYYIRGEVTCGGAELVKTTLDGTTFLLADFGAARDVASTSALVLPDRPPNAAPGARIYFDIYKCANKRSDIYSLDDTEPVPPPGPAGH